MLETEMLENEGLIQAVLLLCAVCICMLYMYDHFMVNENGRAQKNGHSLWDLAGERGLVQTARAD